VSAPVGVRHLDHIREAVREAGADALWVHPAVDFRHHHARAPVGGWAGAAQPRMDAVRSDRAESVWLLGGFPANLRGSA
jgi:hypothetical protein